MTDWEKLKNEYIHANISARELAAKHGVNANTLMSRASRGKWDAERKAVRAEFERICAQKTMEASAEAEADRLATLVRIGAKAARFLEERLDTLMTCGAKAYEVKAIMETVKIIREVYDSGPRTSEDDPLLAYLERLENDG